MLLLPAWVLDSLANAIIGSLLTFFVRYVVKPEYSNQDNWGCAPVGGSDDWKCSSSKVVGMSVVALLMGALVFTPVWLFVAKKLGKRNTWLLWSLSNGITFLCYAPVGAGDVYMCVVMSVFNGAPIGAKFLADAIMADVIDFDEFLTGSRSEATYTMFKGFLPKIAAIPASAVPIVLLSTFGHVPPKDGIIQRQPDSVELFIQLVIIYIPSALAFGAFLIKLRYPLRTARDNDMICEGVSQHLLGRPAMDPCSGIMYQPVDFNEDEQHTVDLLGSFPGIDVVKGMLANWEQGTASIKKRSVMQLAGALVWLVVWAIVTGSTFFLLQTPENLEGDALKEEMDRRGELQFIPVLSIVAFGMGITLVGFSVLRLIAANKLHDHRPTKATLEKILKMRTDLRALKQYRSGCREG